MTKFNLDAMFESAESHYGVRIQALAGAPGARALRNILESVKALYARIASETLLGSVVIFHEISPCGPLGNGLGQPEDHRDFSGFPSKKFTDVVISVQGNGSYRCWFVSLENPRDLATSLSPDALVYYFNRTDGDVFILHNIWMQVPKFISGFSSVFSNPTFDDLSEALVHYHHSQAKFSNCWVLRGVWYDPEKRLHLRAAPEELMRRSLEQFLRTCFRDVEVRPEQNMSETNPVDIKMTWYSSGRIAIIEIKWLGQSVDPDTNRKTQNYSAGRARSGALQLATYLSQNAERLIGQQARGYLVVFDARRGGLGAVRTSVKLSVSQQDALQYRDQEIDYSSVKAALDRGDMEKPIRLFLEPVVV